MTKPEQITWRGLTSDLDRLHLPTVTLAGATEGDLILLITGDLATREPGPSFMLRFYDVESVGAYSEATYCWMIWPAPKTGSMLNVVEGFVGLRDTPRAIGAHHVHYMVLGANMGCEVIAADSYQLWQFESDSDLYEAAAAWLRSESPSSTTQEAMPSLVRATNGSARPGIESEVVFQKQNARP